MRSNACARALTLTPFRCKCDDVEVVVSVLRFYGTKSERHAYLRFKAALVLLVTNGIIWPFLWFLGLLMQLGDDPFQQAI